MTEHIHTVIKDVCYFCECKRLIWENRNLFRVLNTVGMYIGNQKRFKNKTRLMAMINEALNTTAAMDKLSIQNLDLIDKLTEAEKAKADGAAMRNILNDLGFYFSKHDMPEEIVFLKDRILKALSPAPGLSLLDELKKKDERIAELELSDQIFRRHIDAFTEETKKLYEQISELKDVIKSRGELVESWKLANDGWRKRCVKQDELLKEAKSGLEFYGDEENYAETWMPNIGENGALVHSKIDGDGGRSAREILDKLNPTQNPKGGAG